jgi:hypothetical protein
MAVVQPETFTFTDAEAAAVQSAQMAWQMKVAGTAPTIRYSPIIVAFATPGIVFVIDQVWYGGTMPASLFVTLMAVFVAGMATHAAGYWLALRASKRRIRQQTRQFFESRNVRLSDDGIEQALPNQRSSPGAHRSRTGRGADPVWAGHLLVSAIRPAPFHRRPMRRHSSMSAGTRAVGRLAPIRRSRPSSTGYGRVTHHQNAARTMVGYGAAPLTHPTT